MSLTPLPRLRPMLAAAAALLACAGAPSSALAAPQPVTGGELRWTQWNVYDTSAPAGTNRTWLGYVTAAGPPFTNGNASAQSPATGATVTPASPRGAQAANTFTYPVAAGGTYDPETKSGRIELAGTVTFTSSAHGFTITLSNPRVDLNASGAQLFASGQGTPRDGAPKPYDRSAPVFDLSGTLDAFAPAIATPDLVWDAASYPRGAGPDRTPNTFGSFALEIRTEQTSSEPPPAAAPAPPPPPAVERVPVPRVRPSVRCRAARSLAGRPRTRCTVTRLGAATRLSVLAAPRKRLAGARVENGRAVVDLPRKRRRLTFKALDARNRELGRKTQTVGSR